MNLLPKIRVYQYSLFLATHTETQFRVADQNISSFIYQLRTEHKPTKISSKSQKYVKLYFLHHNYDTK